ncbi:glycoside hydrolase family 125 protein [Fulvivirga sp. M361]|nr:glycoside hydrolase family 125 protein [Fulvivirga sp. M361]
MEAQHSNGDFIKLKGLTGVNVFIHPKPFSFDDKFLSQRPEMEERNFTSPAVEHKIEQVKKRIKNEELAWMFENCYPNTLDTTVDFEYIDGKPDTFIITGDIDVMWLRDSTAQVWPYFELIDRDERLKELFRGLINRQAKCVLLDFCANTSYKGKHKVSERKGDKLKIATGVSESKWEIDSLCYFIRLSYRYYELTGDRSAFDESWDQAMRLVLRTFQKKQRKGDTTSSFFERSQGKRTLSLRYRGKGSPSNPIGLIASAFRPSGDGCMYPFCIPSNLFAVEALGQLSEMYIEVMGNRKFADECMCMGKEVREALDHHAVAEHLNYGKIYAYKVDSYGNKLFPDDPNVLSLISLKYLLSKENYDSNVYFNTRRYLLSNDHRYSFKGKVAEGWGGPHTGLYTIRPMGIILRAMTSEDDEEIMICLKTLIKMHDGSGFMHETFHKDDASGFPRSWFARTNTLFGEMILRLSTQKPKLLKSI